MRPADTDRVRASFLKVVADMKARGFLPYFIAFANNDGHATAVAHREIDDVNGFLRWLSFEIAPDSERGH
jgi:hypothetical protein